MGIIQTGIVLTDIVGYSKLRTIQQVAALESVKSVVRTGLLPAYAAASQLRVEQMVLGFVPTGDGFYWVLNSGLEPWAPLLAIGLRNAGVLVSKQLRDVGITVKFRVAAHCGEVAQISDIADHPNFVGDGMNDCARLLGGTPPQKVAMEAFAGGPDYVVASRSALDKLKNAIGVDPTGWLPKIEWREGGDITIEDKHAKTHVARSIEASRYVSLAPPHAQ